jgi:hypothetical protein
MGSCRLVDQCCSDALTRHGRKWVPSCTVAARRNDRSTARPAPWSCCNLNLTRFREPAASQHFSITQRIEGQHVSNFRAHPTLVCCKPNLDEHAVASIKGGRGSQPNIRRETRAQRRLRSNPAPRLESRPPPLSIKRRHCAGKFLNRDAIDKAPNASSKHQPAESGEED